MVAGHADGRISLQATLAAVSATSAEPVVSPHHPITCSSDLRLEDTGRLSCEHTSVPPGDLRTQYCLDHSLALLLLELSHELF